MLLGNTHTAHALNAPGDGGCHFTGYERIFGIVLEISAAQRVAVNVETRRQPDGHTNLQHLSTNCFADLRQKFRVPGLRLYGFTGPCSHIAISGCALSREMLDDRLHLLEPAPLPIRRQPLRILRRSPCGCGRYRNYIQPGRSVGQYNVGDSLFQKSRTGTSGSAHHIVIAPDGVTAAYHKTDFIPVGNPVQNCLNLGRKVLCSLYRNAIPDRLYGFQYTHRLHAETARFLFVQHDPVLPGLQHKSGAHLVEGCDVL